ncbi:FAR1-related sequence 5-like protein [Tanacetum coccineum]
MYCESHGIHTESHEIQMQSHEIHSESHEIHSESHEIHSESHEIHRCLILYLMSESENSFFKSFTSPGATLVSFMMSYESAMERQRYRQEKLDFNTIDAAPTLLHILDIESHASKVYTRTMFLIVQTEINEGCWNCTVQGLNRDEGCEKFVIRDNKAE